MRTIRVMGAAWISRSIKVISDLKQNKQTKYEREFLLPELPNELKIQPKCN